MNAAGYLLFAGADEAIALECGKMRISYGELRVAVRRAAGAWRARGLGQGERVLVFAPDGIEWVIAYLGAIWAGGVAVGLNSRLFEKDLRVVLNESGARFIWCSAGSQALLGGLLAGASEAPRIIVDSDWAAGLGEASQILAHDQPEDAPALWIYTSGTTGIPKAVVHAQRCVLAAGTFAREVLGLGPGDRIYATSKLFFAYALGNNLFGGLAIGATVILDSEWPTAERVAEVVESHRPTVLFSVPTLYLKMLQAGVAARVAAAGVRRYVSAGESLPASVRRQWLEATGVAPVSGYGASETIVLVFYCDDDSAALKISPLTQFRFPEGSDSKAPRRLQIRHSSVALGYWKRPEAHQDGFADGWFSPGDLFCLRADARIEFCGRDDDMLKISGQWVSILDVEQSLLGAAGESLRALAAVGIDNVDGLIEIAVFAVATPGREQEADLSLCAGIEALPKIKRPRLVKWVQELPLTATGKLQRRKLKDLILSA